MNDLALSEAYEKWAADLVRFATALVGPSDAPDVVADAFVELYADGDGWTRADRPRAYLFGVIANRAKMTTRSSVRRRGREERFEHGHVPGADAPAEASSDGPADARRLLGRVSMQQRTFLYLAYWEDWSVDQIADHAGVSEGTVRKQLARARSKIREEMP